MQDKKLPLAMKVQPTTHIFQKEIHSLKSIWRRRETLKLDEKYLRLAKTP